MTYDSNARPSKPNVDVAAARAPSGGEEAREFFYHGEALARLRKSQALGQTATNEMYSHTTYHGIRLV